MARRFAHLGLSAGAWLGFTAIMVWMIAFLAGVGVPHRVDAPTRTPAPTAIAIDVSLLRLFAVQHSVMARRRVKEWLGRYVGNSLERTTYVLATDVCLGLLLVFWQPWGGSVWRVSGLPSTALWVLCAVGWSLALGSTFAVDHLELTGLRQAGRGARRRPVWAGHRGPVAASSGRRRRHGEDRPVRSPLGPGGARPRPIRTCRRRRRPSHNAVARADRHG